MYSIAVSHKSVIFPYSPAFIISYGSGFDSILLQVTPDYARVDSLSIIFPNVITFDIGYIFSSEYVFHLVEHGLVVAGRIWCE